MNRLLYWCLIPLFSVSLLGMTKCRAAGFGARRGSQDAPNIKRSGYGSKVGYTRKTKVINNKNKKAQDDEVKKVETIPLELSSFSTSPGHNIQYELTDNLTDIVYPLNGTDTHFGLKTTLNLKEEPFFTRYMEFYDPTTSQTLATVSYGGLWETGREGSTEYYLEHICGPIKINNVGMDSSLFEAFKNDYMKKAEENGYDTKKNKGIAKNLKNNKIIEQSFHKLSYQDSILNIYYKFESDRFRF